MLAWEVQSIGARLERMCPRRDLNFVGARRACTISSLDNENVSWYFVSVAQSASIVLDSTRVPTGGV